MARLSNRDANKKAAEIAAFEATKRRLGTSWELLEVMEPPDLVIGVDGRRIGLEVTRLYHDDDERKRAGTWEKTVAKARFAYEKAGLPPLRVSVLFNQTGTGEWACRKDGNAFPTVLANFVAGTEPDAGKTWPVDPARFPALLKTYLDWLYIAPAECNDWSSVAAGTVQAISQSAIQQAIDKKHEKLGDYREAQLDGYWLLIHAPSELGAAEDTDNEALQAITVRTSLGSTPKSRTVWKGLKTSDPACLGAVAS